MEFEYVKTADITCEWLETRGPQLDRHKQRKTSGSPSGPQAQVPGTIRKALAKQWLVHTLTAGWVEDLRSNSDATAAAAAECDAVLAFFRDFRVFGKKFSPGGKDEADNSTVILEDVKHR